MVYAQLVRSLKLSGLLLFFVIAVSPLAAQSTEPVSANLDTLTVVAISELDIETGPGSMMSVLLSSDGERVLSVSRAGFCFYTISGEQLNCTPMPDGPRYDPASLRWSRDGRYVAYIDDLPFRNFRDSDLWVLDTQTLTFTNLTDDGDLPSVLDTVTNPNLTGPLAPVDYLPRFSDDGMIYFIRLEVADSALSTSIYRIPVTGGEAEQVAALASNAREEGYPIEWDIAPDGQTGVYAIGTSREQTIRSVDLASGERALLHGVDPETEVGVVSLEFSPHGDAVLWHSQIFAIFGRNAEQSTAYITTLEGDTFPATTAPNATYFGWAYDGSAIIYSVYDEANPERTGLYLSLPGKEGTLLIAPEEPNQWFIATRFPTALFWAANNTLLTAAGIGEPLLALHLGTE